MNKLDQAIQVVGMSIITTNEAAQNQQTIAKLWDEFLKSPIKEKIGDLASASIYSVYSDYENEYYGKYRVTLGFAVKDASKIPAGLSKVTIKAGKYKTYQAKSPAVEDIVDVWKTIWQKDPNLTARSYVSDFEEYKENEVFINIGHE